DYKNLNQRHWCLEWLDKQEPNSVIFVSFGTTTSLTDEQVEELAVGLEESEQRFIWVLRDADKGDVFEGEARKFELTEAYEQRIEGKGIVVRDWAPQIEILGHPSTGGFMSHCGWNSCMESMSMGIDGVERRRCDEVEGGGIGWRHQQVSGGRRRYSHGVRFVYCSHY
ncbi:hypothetical protein RJ640_028918, partial [Escallonia rubra]